MSVSWGHLGLAHETARLKGARSQCNPQCHYFLLLAIVGWGPSVRRCGAGGLRAALARVGRAGSFGFFELQDFAMRQIWTFELKREKAVCGSVSIALMAQQTNGSARNAQRLHERIA